MLTVTLFSLTMGCAPASWTLLETWLPAEGLEIGGCDGCAVEASFQPGSSIAARGQDAGQVWHAERLWQFWTLAPKSERVAEVQVESWSEQGEWSGAEGYVYADWRGFDVELDGVDARLWAE